VALQSWFVMSFENLWDQTDRFAATKLKSFHDEGVFLPRGSSDEHLVLVEKAHFDVRQGKADRAEFGLRIIDC
jgi:hypothetical protein